VRLDKFLQVSRLVRRRTLAHALCHAGRVAVNGRAAGAAAAVAVGDVITLEYGARRVRARVRAVPERPRPGGDYVDVLEEQPIE
jgi:ribosomal 50S subunit-recycling heat shock protein